MFLPEIDWQVCTSVFGGYALFHFCVNKNSKFYPFSQWKTASEAGDIAHDGLHGL